jgi:3-phenylpropionate/trans-cinnamate dioxygenase ferredoxin subunit
MSLRIQLGPADFAEGEMRGYEVGKSNVVVAKVGGEYQALDDWCNHAGCLLSGGRLQGNVLVCPCHEVGFDVATGRNVTSPGICDDQRAFKVQVEGGHLFLEGWSPEW